MELLKERDELHEDLISMVGETSRLREEVVRLEQGLASACRRLPPTNKYNSSVLFFINCNICDMIFNYICVFY